MLWTHVFYKPLVIPVQTLYYKLVVTMYYLEINQPGNIVTYT